MKESQLEELEQLTKEVRLANDILDDIEHSRPVFLQAPYYNCTLEFCGEENRTLLSNFLKSFVSLHIDKLKAMGVRFE